MADISTTVTGPDFSLPQGVVERVTHFLEDPWLKIGGVELNPFDLAIGSMFLTSTVIYIIKFINRLLSCRDEHVIRSDATVEQWDFDRVTQTVILGIKGFGYIARSLDWAIEKAFFVAMLSVAIAARAIGHIAGVITYFYEAFSILDILASIDRGEVALEANRNYDVTSVHRDVIWQYKTVKWLQFFGNLCFASNSGLCLAALFFSISLSPASTILIVGAMVCFAVSHTMHWSLGNTAIIDTILISDPTRRHKSQYTSRRA